LLLSLSSLGAAFVFAMAAFVFAMAAFFFAVAAAVFLVAVACLSSLSQSLPLLLLSFRCFS